MSAPGCGDRLTAAAGCTPAVPGASGRFTRRATDRASGKCAVIGLLAAAAGCRRTDSIERLFDLRFAVRTDLSAYGSGGCK